LAVSGFASAHRVKHECATTSNRSVAAYCTAAQLQIPDSFIA
jgi:hypothetical protein